MIFPTIFKHPFPHIQTITVLLLHSNITLAGTYYLFVEKIGMTKQELIKCCVWTTLFLIFVSVFNIITGSNYAATTRLPAHLINFGINVPASLCSITVISGYLFITVCEYLLINDYRWGKK